MKNQKIKTGKLQMKAMLLAGLLIFESVFAGIGPVNAQTVSENEIVSVEDTMSKSTTLSQENREIKTEEVALQGDSAQTPKILYSGTDGAVNWSIDKNGQLLLTGDGDYEGDPDWLEHSSEIISAVVAVKNMTRTTNMFYFCSEMVGLSISTFDTSKVTDMSGMFRGCSGFTELNLSTFNTENVSDMSYMFASCTNLTTLDISSFDTRNVTTMTSMFMYCFKLTNLDVSKFDTSNVTSMSGMFADCESLTSLDVSNFVTSNVEYFSCMFMFCRKLTKLDVSKFDTSKATSMDYMFHGCFSVENLDVSKFDTNNVTNMESMFCNCDKVTKLDVSGFCTGKVTDMKYMFGSCDELTSLDVSNFDTSKVTDMSSMFTYCKNLTSLNVTNFDTSKVTDMSYMFNGCENLTSLDVSNFSTGNVTDMSAMFRGCTQMTELDLSTWDLSSLKKAADMLYRMDSLVTFQFSNTPIEIELPKTYYDENNVETNSIGTNQGNKSYGSTEYSETYCGKNGHTYSSPVFTWAEDYSSAKMYMECIREDCTFVIDDKYVQMDAVVAKEVIDSTTEKEGATVYTATAVHKGKTYTDVKSVAIAKLPQQPAQPTAKPVGTSFKTSTTFYRVTKAGKAPEIAYMGPKNKKVKKVTIPATVKMDGVTYKVTSIATGALKNYKNLTKVTVGKNVTKIGKNAFYGCKKLKKIVIKGKKLKIVGKNALKGIKKIATIDVPNSKKKAYKKLLKAKTGYKKTMKVK